MDSKACTKCKEEKPLTEFYKAPTGKLGVRGDCKVCVNSKVKRYRHDNKDGIASMNRRYRLRNRDRVLEYSRKYREENAEKIKESARKRREENRDAACAYAAKFRKENPGYQRKYSVRRRAAKLQRTVSWANEQLIAAYYTEAKRLEELTGIKFHVDHIIPLQGELVSGLHVETNLQLLPAHENIGKSNSFDPDLFVA